MGFCLKPQGFCWVFIFAPIRSYQSFEIRLSLPSKPGARPYLPRNLTNSQILVKQICVPSIILTVTSNRSFQKRNCNMSTSFSSLSIRAFFIFFCCIINAFSEILSSNFYDSLKFFGSSYFLNLDI